MPYVHLHTLKGLLSPQQKRALMDRMTALLVEIEGGGDPAFRKHVWIRIDEGEPEQWQLGELRPTPDLVERLVEVREARRAAGEAQDGN
ncbi:MAG TPA: tautomerase family protein [Noviherbaspirillum sp.]|uniref:tautomerase family protein n=1 Tax=Noviherbaspirillum sp. TaxID=1926288 RepID=UPI002D478F3F|nr:tautomerase family protein [Noviherbaspirillum sp.]HYD94133.1 tautomerase family protein [Noviherbaspirillum sp.]